MYMCCKVKVGFVCAFFNIPIITALTEVESMLVGYNCSIMLIESVLVVSALLVNLTVSSSTGSSSAEKLRFRDLHAVCLMSCAYFHALSKSSND